MRPQAGHEFVLHNLAVISAGIKPDTFAHDDSRFREERHGRSSIARTIPANMPANNKFVQRIGKVPVNLSQQSHRIENRGLADRRGALLCTQGWVTRSMLSS